MLGAARLSLVAGVLAIVVVLLVPTALPAQPNTAGAYEFDNGQDAQWVVLQGIPLQQGNICLRLLDRAGSMVLSPYHEDVLRIYGPKGGEANVVPNPDLRMPDKFFLKNGEDNTKTIMKTVDNVGWFAEFACDSSRTGEVYFPWVWPKVVEQQAGSAGRDASISVLVESWIRGPGRADSIDGERGSVDELGLLR